MRKIFLSILTLASAAVHAGAVLINGNQINPATSITIASDTVTGKGMSASVPIFSVGVSTLVVRGGKVGIGNTNPTYLLDIGSGTTVSPNTLIRRGSDDTAQNLALGYDRIVSQRTGTAIASAQTTLAFIQQGSDGTRTNIYIDGSGNVGVGTTAPAYPLDVTGTERATKFYGVSDATETFNASMRGVGTTANPAGIDSSSGVVRNASGFVPNDEIDPSSITKLSSGLVPNSLIDGSSITKMGNGFNGSSQLFKLDSNSAAQLNGSISATTATVRGNAFSVGVSTLVASGGMVGIGNSSPSYLLDIGSGTTVSPNTKIRRGSDDTNQNLLLGYDRIVSQRADTAIGSAQTSLSFIQQGSNGTRTNMNIDSSGNVTVGNNGTPLALISTGTYTPTLTNVANTDSSSVSAAFMFYRIGNLVTVTGSISIDPTLSVNTATEVDISVPVASNFTGSYDGQGVGNANAAQRGGFFYTDATNDRMQFVFKSETTASNEYTVYFTYTIK